LIHAGCCEADVTALDQPAVTAERVRSLVGHLSFGIEDLDRSARFYDAVLAPIGYIRVWSSAKGVGYGAPGGGDKLALFARPGQARPPGPGFHLAIDASTRSAVDAFHAAAPGLCCSLAANTTNSLRNRCTPCSNGKTMSRSFFIPVQVLPGFEPGEQRSEIGIACIVGGLCPKSR
jgi:hypothetical protein